MRFSLMALLVFVSFAIHANESNSKLTNQNLRRFYCEIRPEGQEAFDVQIRAKDADSAVQTLTAMADAGQFGKFEKPVPEIVCKSVHFPSNM